MNSMVDLRHKDTRELVRSLDVLKDLPVLGKGWFSAVFDNGNSVYKLTIDKQGYEFITGATPSPMLPEVIRDLGNVGLLFDNDDCECPAYLIEIEKLLPKGYNPKVLPLARAIVKANNGGYMTKGQRKSVRKTYPSDMEFYANLSAERLRNVARAFGNDDLMTAADSIGNFLNIRCDSASMDLHIDNMMVRPSNQMLVLSDPISGGGADVFNRAET